MEAKIGSDEYLYEQAPGIYLQDDLVDAAIDSEVLRLVTADIAAKFFIVPVGVENGLLLLATNMEQAFKRKNEIEEMLYRPVKMLLAREENVKSALAHYYQINSSSYTRKASGGQAASIDDTPLKRKINALIHDAVEKQASDIHILPNEEQVNVHFRINGHLIDLTAQYDLKPEEAPNVINIIKSMDTSGQTDVANTNMPTQGSFDITHGQMRVDLRLSTIPVVNVAGLQKVNLRLLRQDNKRIRLTDLGYAAEDLKAIRATLLSAASGMFLNSGPTGSGKTTSLYAQIYAVLEMLQEPLNIMTIENPVEIKEARFCQVQVRESQAENTSLSAPLILHTGLRQDPDTFLYGEIRDKRDAEVAIEAAMTGHKVFSTVHARNCVATIARLLDLGVSRTSLLSELNMIISQRLVGVLCPECAVSHELTGDELSVLTPEEIQFLSGAALKARAPREAYTKCNCNFGYVGRVAVVEYVIFDMALRDAFLTQNVGFLEIANVLRNKGFRNMWQKGLDLVKCGKTDLMEILRTIGKM